MASLVSLLLSGCSGCSNKKSEPGSVQDMIETYTPVPQMDTSGADTAEVMKQVQLFTDRLKNSDVNGAMDLLYYLDKDSIKHLPPELAKRERITLSAIQGAVRYDLDGLVFSKEKDSEARLIVTLFDKPASDKRPNTLGVIIKPVRRDGRWFLTLADSESDTNHGTEIKH